MVKLHPKSIGIGIVVAGDGDEGAILHGSVAAAQDEYSQLLLLAF